MSEFWCKKHGVMHDRVACAHRDLEDVAAHLEQIIKRVDVLEAGLDRLQDDVFEIIRGEE